MSEQKCILDLDAIEARANAATPGPWFYDSYSTVHAKCMLAAYEAAETDEECYAANPAVCSVPAYAGDTAGGRHVDNAKFVAAAREDVPALVAEVRRLLAKKDELGRELAAALERERLLRAGLAVVATDVDGVWRWQGDGYDHPESLSCPVVMSASTLRGLLGPRVECESRPSIAGLAEKWAEDAEDICMTHENLVAEVRRLRRLVDEAAEHLDDVAEVHLAGVTQEQTRALADGLREAAKAS
jgi:hypothetical protein